MYFSYQIFVFQVDTDSLYLTDSANVALFPMENGDFCSLDLTDRGHYEVHGGELQGQVTALSQRSFSFAQRSSSSPVANFTPPPRASTPSPRSFQR